jgi:molybdenum cofactor guanylyltransferase
MIEHVIAALEPQAGDLIISANRNLDRYRNYGYPVVTDTSGGYSGPLAGLASGMQAADTRHVLCIPCDAPLVPATVAAVLMQALHDDQAHTSVAHDGVRMQPLFALLRSELLGALLAYLDAGGHRVESWCRRQRLTLADFSSCTDAFVNLNTPEDICASGQPPERSLTTAGPAGNVIQRKIHGRRYLS